MQALRITPEDAQDIAFWKSRIRAVDPHLERTGEEEEDKYDNYNYSELHHRTILISFKTITITMQL